MRWWGCIICSRQQVNENAVIVWECVPERASCPASGRGGVPRGDLIPDRASVSAEPSLNSRPQSLKDGAQHAALHFPSHPRFHSTAYSVCVGLAATMKNNNNNNGSTIATKTTTKKLFPLFCFLSFPLLLPVTDVLSQRRTISC